MELTFIASIFAVFFFIFLILNSYVMNVFYKGRRARRNFLDAFESRVKGLYYPQGYFHTNQRVIFPREFSRLSEREKGKFTHCYNVVTFKSEECDWEIFFYLVKEGLNFKEFLNIKCFPRNIRIHSEANAENNKGRINTFANNRYLTGIMENSVVYEHLKILLDENGDNFHVLSNNLHLNICIDNRNISFETVFNYVKSINNIKNKIYKKDIIGY